MEPVSDLAIDLPRVEVMGSPKGQTVIQEEAPVADVHRLNCDRQALSEALSER
jgi:hypothetical protein